MKKYNNPRMKSQFGGVLLIALLALASCSSGEQPIAIETATVPENENTYELSLTQFKSSDMKLGKLEMKEFHEIVKANGMFDVPPENRASVSTYFAGTVKDIRLLPGEQVKKGQTLFILENPDYVQLQQDYLEAKGKLNYLKADYERQKNLFQDKVTSQKNYLKAESDYTVTRVKLQSLGKKLSLMNINAETLTLENIRTTLNITSPINGYVTQVNITQSAFLNSSEAAITIVDTDHMHLELNLFEKDLTKVKIGQPIQFKIQEDKSNTYKALVHLVNKTVDPESRTIGIHGHLLSGEALSSRFSPGMYVEAEIYTSADSKVALPQDALVEIEGKYYVLMLEGALNDGYTFSKQEVKTGAANNGFVEIVNFQEFKDNTEFLVKGAFNIITE